MFGGTEDIDQLIEESTKAFWDIISQDRKDRDQKKQRKSEVAPKKQATVSVMSDQTTDEVSVNGNSGSTGKQDASEALDGEADRPTDGQGAPAMAPTVSLAKDGELSVFIVPPSTYKVLSIQFTQAHLDEKAWMSQLYCPLCCFRQNN